MAVLGGDELAVALRAQSTVGAPCPRVSHIFRKRQPLKEWIGIDGGHAGWLTELRIPRPARLRVGRMMRPACPVVLRHGRSTRSAPKCGAAVEAASRTSDSGCSRQDVDLIDGPLESPRDDQIWPSIKTRHWQVSSCSWTDTISTPTYLHRPKTRTRNRQDGATGGTTPRGRKTPRSRRI